MINTCIRLIFLSEQLAKKWTPPIYAFFEPTPELNMFRAKGAIYSSAVDEAAKKWFSSSLT